MSMSDHTKGTLRVLMQKARDKPNNMYYTPDYAMDFIYDYVRSFKRVWEPCCGYGHMVRYFEARDHQVTGTDIHQGSEFDFYTYAPPPESYDIIITNPPFQKKYETIIRLFELGKPFAVLLPTIILDSNPIRRILKEHVGEWGFVMPNRKINYIMESEKGSTSSTKPTTASQSFFHSSWLCRFVPNVTGLVIV